MSLPSSLLAQLSDRIGADDPILVRMRPRAIEGTAGVLCGVRDFAAEEGTVVVPHWVLAALDGAKDGSVAYLMVESLADSLLPATFCRFEPLDASFFALEDHRAVLEAALTTHYVALSRGTVISISHLGARHALRVAELEPEEHCSVYRADVSVDVVPPAGSERTAAAALAAAQAPPAATVVLEVPFGDRAGLRVPCPAPGGGATFARVVAPPGAAVQLEVRTETPGPFDFEAYACEARGGAARPTRQDHTHSCVRGDNYRSAILELPAAEADSNLGGPSVWHLGLTGYGAGAVGGECIVVAGPCDDAAAPAPPAESGMARCGNCGAAVPTASLARHEAFCARSNAICLVCDRVVRRQDLESGLHWHCDKCLDPPFVCDSSEARSKHLELYHTPIRCSCGIEQPGLREAATHLAHTCERRSILCRFCRNRMAAGPPADDPVEASRGYTAHEALCGGKTVACPDCGKYVRRRDLAVHRRLHTMGPATVGAGGAAGAAGGSAAPAAVPTTTTTSSSPPPVCVTALCAGIAAAAPPGFCDACRGKLAAATPGVAVPTDTPGLLKVLVRAYYAQLTSGCGDAGCTNAHCATVAPGLDPNAAAATAIRLAKATFTDKCGALCVGSNQRARCAPHPSASPVRGHRLTRSPSAELVAQVTSMGFDAGWAVAGLGALASGAELPSMDNLVRWVLSNQPHSQ